MINLAIVEGRLTKDVELRYTQNNKAHTNIIVACNKGKDEQGNDLGTDYISVAVWGKWAEMASKWFKKGDGIVVIGRTSTRNYDDPNVPNKKVFVQEITADRITFPESKKVADKPAETPTSFSIGRDDLPF